MINREEARQVISALTDNLTDVLFKMVLENANNILELHQNREFTADQLRLIRYIEQHPENLVSSLSVNDENNSVLALKYVREAGLNVDMADWYKK